MVFYDDGHLTNNNHERRSLPSVDSYEEKIPSSFCLLGSVENPVAKDEWFSIDPICNIKMAKVRVKVKSRSLRHS